MKKGKAKKDTFKKENSLEKEMCCKNYGGNCGGCFYFLGVVGAAVYYIQASTGFWAGVLGVLKALVWPAFLIHKLLGL